MKIPFILIGLLLTLVSCEEQKEVKQAKPETLVDDYSEDEMNEAISIARDRIDEFLKVLEEGDADTFTVKAPITDDHGTEHFWLTDISYSGGVFSGSVGNDPGIVKNVEFGQSWNVKRDDISDWMFTRGDKIHGGFTIDPLLHSYPKDEAEALRARLVR